jgi:hypothetical protein
LDGNNNTPNSQAISREQYLAQVEANEARIYAKTGETERDSKEAWQRGTLSKDEYYKTHGEITVINGNVKSQVSSIKSKALESKPLNIAKSHGNTSVYVQESNKPRVLVS